MSVFLSSDLNTITRVTPSAARLGSKYRQNIGKTPRGPRCARQAKAMSDKLVANAIKLLLNYNYMRMFLNQYIDLCCAVLPWLATHLSPRALTSFASLEDLRIDVVNHGVTRPARARGSKLTLFSISFRSNAVKR